MILSSSQSYSPIAQEHYTPPSIQQQAKETCTRIQNVAKRAFNTALPHASMRRFVVTSGCKVAGIAVVTAAFISLGAVIGWPIVSSLEKEESPTSNSEKIISSGIVGCEILFVGAIIAGGIGCCYKEWYQSWHAEEQEIVAMEAGQLESTNVHQAD